ncbi:MAG: VWA domain-containing protein [Nannocystaceae bacterium]
MNQKINIPNPERDPEDMRTEIAIILDRSGSMDSIREDMEGGLWSLVCAQHQAPGTCAVSLYTFDDEFETAFEGRPAGQLRSRDCRIEPRGCTALLDAVVRGLATVERRMLDQPEDARPDFVSVVVITDGHENASRESSLADAKRAVERATDKLEWTFSFLAADLDGFADGEAFTADASDADARYFDREDARAATHALSDRILEERTTRARRRARR